MLGLFNVGRTEQVARPTIIEGKQGWPQYLAVCQYPDKSWVGVKDWDNIKWPVKGGGKNIVVWDCDPNMSIGEEDGNGSNMEEVSLQTHHHGTAE